MPLKDLLHRCFSDTHVGAEVCAWTAILTNAFWLCVTAMGWGPYAILLTFHAIVGIILGTDLKEVSRKEHIKRYGAFLAVNGIVVLFEVIMLIWLIADTALHPKHGEPWYIQGDSPPLLLGSFNAIIYMLVEVPLNVTIGFYVRAAYKRAGAPTRSLSPVSGA
ncbi:hypothetical protein AAVH_14739 [Aphelenchoides avenae]|nr:hypothetical protein AAVH_14739 [Aphelenchus avenae]